MTPKDMLIPIAVLLLQMWAIKWVDVKIKFAQNEAEAMSAIKDGILRVISFLANFGGASYVIYSAIKDAPIGRFDVIFICFISVGIGVRVSLGFTLKLAEVVKHQMGSLVKAGEIFNTYQTLFAEIQSEIEELKKKN